MTTAPTQRVIPAKGIHRDQATIADLVHFAGVEVTSRDVEPWADLIGELYRSEALDLEEALWVLYLYNAYDAFDSAWSAFRSWPSPRSWYLSSGAHLAADLPIMRERRNLHGGRMLRRHASYCELLAGGTQAAWLRRGIPHPAEPVPTPQKVVNFHTLMRHVRAVWGVGRQAAFEWAEFVAKVTGWPLVAGHGALWESSGPRESLERLYRVGRRAPNQGWLDGAAMECRATMDRAGVTVDWLDFETVICDFNVMRAGRYYPGQHLAALRGEIANADTTDRPMLEAAWAAVVPEPWRDIAPGICQKARSVYKRTGLILAAPIDPEELP